jgi:DNA primase
VYGEDAIGRVREQTDIVALIGEHVTLKRSGASFKGLCPFHSEKSPSFYVHPQRQFFHCFGCQASGDVITFVMKLEGLAFPEAVRRLAERAGVELPSADPREESVARQARERRSRLISITEAAAGYYLRMLGEHPLGSMARAEIEKRRVTPEVAATYRLGYAPPGWDGLARFLAQKGYSPAECEEVGLLVPRRAGDGHYDRFRHRLMFPIATPDGHIVAFSGRALPTPPGEAEPEEPPAKYVNSPEGPLYKKGELLFGLNEARVELRREGEAILCEGNFDVVAVHQAGLKNVVAPLGTAFTPMQAKLLRKYVSKVTVIFDGDRAGKKAVLHAYPLLAEAALPAKVVTLPGGADPDSFVRERGADALRALVSAAPPIVDHLIDQAAGEAGSDPALRAQAIESLGPILARIESPVERGLYVERVAQAFQVADLEAVRRVLRKGVRTGAKPERRTGLEEKASEQAARPAPTTLPAVEKDIVGAFLDQPALFGGDGGERVIALMTSPELRSILRAAARMIEDRGHIDAPLLLAGAAEGAREWLGGRLAKQDHDLTSAESFLTSALALMRKEQLARDLRELERSIKEALRSGEQDKAMSLMRQRDELFRGRGRPS